jgi:hypothetical protein
MENISWTTDHVRNEEVLLRVKEQRNILRDVSKWKLQEEYSKWAVAINIAKTKHMSLGTDRNHLEMDNSDVITGCTEFRYLGSVTVFLACPTMFTDELAHWSYMNPSQGIFRGTN